jgi:hypothetical protein
MKALPFLPFTFLAGAHGFAMFAPYAAVALGLLVLAAKRRQAKAPVRVRADRTARRV